jgi:hypothetical protein
LIGLSKLCGAGVQPWKATQYNTHAHLDIVKLLSSSKRKAIATKVQLEPDPMAVSSSEPHQVIKSSGSPANLRFPSNPSLSGYQR